MPTGRRRGKNPTTKRTARTRQKSQETLGKFAKAYPEMINRENWWFTHGRRELARIIENLKHLESIRKSAGQAVKEGAKDAEIKKKAILSASLAQRTITEARQLLKIGQRRLRS
ncbi:hypothetical protein KJ972_04210, partial [Candidatus Micrarchaeota archaeon]|nr:hypothetical protein [Candidatus Micrarchaeota archaeon]